MLAYAQTPTPSAGVYERRVRKSDILPVGVEVVERSTIPPRGVVER